MIEMLALILFVAVLVAMIAAPDRNARAIQTESIPTAAVEPSVAQTA